MGSDVQGQIYSRNRGKKLKPVFSEVTLDTLDVVPINKILDYKGFYTRYFDLIHTCLELTPSFEDRTIRGVATLTLSPHFYTQSEVVLDAKGMVFDSIKTSLDNFKSSAKYTYDGMKLYVNLGKEISNTDTFNLKIYYLARPYLLTDTQRAQGQGAYFINNLQSNPYRTTLFWTQGEPEAASCWFPTFDATNQKCTQEMVVTVPDSMRTISNGRLIKSTCVGDSLRTDYWRQDLPHSPYLFALVVGPLEKYVENWKGKEISYYTLKPYLKDVQKVFGHTPQMIDYFSSLLKYDFPWDNYKQVPVYDFVAGAMENTTFTVTHEGLMTSDLDLKDKILRSDPIIAHELFHQWFGDLVTCNSWSQLALNESFADYGAYLWIEKWKGKDDAEIYRKDELNSYLNEFTYHKVEPIVQYYYDSPKELFDRHRYNKGGLVLNMLRQVVGEDAFFASLHRYLQTNAFQSVEVAQLQKAFEDVVGKDLSWFFNQWFYQPGHPIVQITHDFDSVRNKMSIHFLQTQNTHPNVQIPIHKMVVPVDMIYSDTIVRQIIQVTNKRQTFEFVVKSKPLTVLVDPGKIQLWQATYDYSPEELMVIYKRSKDILDQLFVLDELVKKELFGKMEDQLTASWTTRSWYLKKRLAEIISEGNFPNNAQYTSQIKGFLSSPESYERAFFLQILQKLHAPDLLTITQNLIEKDSSNLVKSVCLGIFLDSNKQQAYTNALPLMERNNISIQTVIARILGENSYSKDLPFFERTLLSMTHTHIQPIFESFEKYLLAVDDETFAQGMSVIQNIIFHEYPNQRVSSAKELLQHFQKMDINQSGMNAQKRYVANHLLD